MITAKCFAAKQDACKVLTSGFQSRLEFEFKVLNCLPASFRLISVSNTRSEFCSSSLFDLNSDTACGFLQEPCMFLSVIYTGSCGRLTRTATP